ncbi:MAG: lysophospholipid acyltransferase family protein [Elusimicrobiota bacterium]
MRGGERVPFLHRQLQTLAHWLFGVYHDIRVEGAAHVPRSGPAIIAANHPTYLDGAFLMVGLTRAICFMAWEKPFRVPLLGMLMRHYGAIPVDMKKPGRASFEAAVKILRGGKIFGIFPEGGRTKGLTPMNPLKSGVARLALITGAPIVPATIIGGRRVWRKGDLLPKPGPIRVVFHPPIYIDASERPLWRRDKRRERRIVERLIATIHMSLLPSLRRDKRLDRLLRGAPQRPRPEVEGIPPLFLLLCGLFLPPEAWASYGRPAVIWVSAYVLLLGLEIMLEMRGWFVKWLRHLLPWAALAGVVHQVAGFPGVDNWPYALAEAVFAALLVWCTIFRFPLYRRVRPLLLAVAYGTWLLQIMSWGAQ